ncbi:MAG: hypothetical protein IKB80_03555 [Oscillospiraceae bacterium]|nr:hypothetical protein [Oscillospiraceae bacterium]
MAVAYIWAHISMACKNEFGLIFGKTFNYCTIVILTLLIELVAVYVIRIDNLKIKEAYENTHTKEAYTFQTDFAETLKSKDHILHTAAFNTLMLLLFLLIGMGTKATAIPLVIGAIAMTIVSIILFAVISTLIWCIVHKKWLCSQKK